MRVTSITLLLSAMLALFAVTAPGQAAATTAPTWSLPVPTTTQAPFTTTGTLNQLTCADAEDCFAGAVTQSADGVIYQTGDGGQSWNVARAANTVGGGPFACAPDTSQATPFCISIIDDQIQNLSAAGTPITGPSNVVVALNLASALSCPSASLCVATVAADAGKDGEIVSSTDPLTGAWTDVNADPGHALEAISCPDTGLCVAVDNGGAVLTSTDPTSGTWTRTELGSGLDSVSCASEQLCVAVSSSGAAYASTSPATGAWNLVSVTGASDLTGVSCPTTTFCALSDASGSVYGSTNPANGDFSELAGLSSGLGAISCPTSSSCLVLDGADVLHTTDVGAGGAWTSVGVDAGSPLAAISCPSSALCVALQHDGRADSTTTPLDVSAPWTITPADTQGTPVALSCPTASACFGVDSAGRLLWSSTPATGGWHSLRIDLKSVPVAISCPSASFCAMVDRGGRIFTSANPTGGFSAWREVSRATPTKLRATFTETLTSITCTSASFCLATDSGGWIYTTTTPRGSAGAWKATQIFKSPTTGDYALVKASCPASTNCTVMGTYAGWLKESQYDPDALGTYALTSTRPAAGATAWKSRQIDNGYVESDASTVDAGLATGLSCPTTSLCAMVDDLGTAVTNTGSASAATWLSASIDALATPEMSDGHPGLTGVSCFRGGHCVAIDGFGNRFSFGIGAGPITPIANAHYYSG